MSGPRPNLVNLERVSKAYGVRPLLADVSLGVGEGDRVGVVGRNGDGKTTLLRVLTGVEGVDDGRVSRQRGLLVGYLRQGDDLDDTHTVREAVLGGRADHEWAADPTTRDVVEQLLAGVSLDRAVHGLSGGERRRCSLAVMLLDRHDLLVLDEPTNHLDVEAVDWLARHLRGRPDALVVVTHDRWFLDAVCATTWEVHDGAVDVYDGGYAAFVLAKAERQRQAAATEARRQNLVRKELAWLRRGPPARTSKPKFRVDAATALVADEPEPRDRLELQRFATQRLGKDVVDLEDVDLVRGERRLLHHATWRLGPGDRVGLVGVNGAGKTSVLSLLGGDVAPSAGRVRHGRTVALAQLGQHLDDLDPTARVLDTVEEVRRVTRTADGEVTATAMLERFGFTGDRLTARIGDLSGGERRRFQLLRILLDEPNVLLLDEPTNDLDIETLTVLEDFLDSWPGTLVVVSHDRYFLERTTDSVWALLGDGRVSMLPRGVEEYLERRRAGTADLGTADPAPVPPADPARVDAGPAPVGTADPAPVDRPAAARAGSAEERAARKALARIDKRLERVAAAEAELEAEVQAHLADHERLADLGRRQAASWRRSARRSRPSGWRLPRSSADRADPAGRSVDATFTPWMLTPPSTPSVARRCCGCPQSRAWGAAEGGVMVTIRRGPFRPAAPADVRPGAPAVHTPDAAPGPEPSRGSDVFVLSGGASRGAVQAGMLRGLLEAGVRPDGLVGTSVGALNACFVAPDPSLDRVRELETTWGRLTRRDIFPGSHLSLLGRLARHPGSLYSSCGLERLVAEWASVDRVEDLAVPTRVTTTHLASGSAVYHGTGDLRQVLLASAALPAIFEPVLLPDHAAGQPSPHIDGGIADNVPVGGVADLAASLPVPVRRVFVLDASVPVRLDRPRSPVHVLITSLGVAMRVRPLPDLGPGVEVHHLRAPDLAVRMHDFSRTAEHVDLGRRAVDELLASPAGASLAAA